MFKIEQHLHVISSIFNTLVRLTFQSLMYFLCKHNTVSTSVTTESTKVSNISYRHHDEAIQSCNKGRIQDKLWLKIQKKTLNEITNNLDLRGGSSGYPLPRSTNAWTNACTLPPGKQHLHTYIDAHKHTCFECSAPMANPDLLYDRLSLMLSCDAVEKCSKKITKLP